MHKKLIDNIITPSDLRLLSREDLSLIANELREEIIKVVSSKEGHLGASLGVIELTIALHYVFNTPDDLIVWDVGHQAYSHKILTGRKDKFSSNRQLGGISGFPKRSESIYDTFGTGHASTSISAALGMAIASSLNGLDKHHIAVIGDASIAGGMAFEGLNHAGITNANLLVILNDNAIGIDPSVGALKEYLNNYKAKNHSTNSFFEALNFNFFGPIDGNDVCALVNELEKIKVIKGPKLLHIKTVKGKGLIQAEKNQVKYHAPGKFDAKTGELFTEKNENKPRKFQHIFGMTLVELAKKNTKIIGITPAMPTGSSMKYMIEKFPERAFDVGIAEQHAVTFAAGLATQGFTPFCAIYSTFLQRSYDQVIHDVALQKLPVVFCLDRAGLVGQDGATHHGVFDIAYLRCIPNMVIAAPRNEIELRNIMYTAQKELKSTIAIRYPRGRVNSTHWETPFEEIAIGTAKQLKIGENIAVLSLGSIAKNIEIAIKELPFSHYDMRFAKPIDEKLLIRIFEKYDKIVTVEDGTIIGGFGSAILEFAGRKGFNNKVYIKGIPDQFIEHGTIEELQKEVGLDPESLMKFISSLV